MSGKKEKKDKRKKSKKASKDKVESKHSRHHYDQSQRIISPKKETSGNWRSVSLYSNKSRLSSENDEPLVSAANPEKYHKKEKRHKLKKSSHHKKRSKSRSRSRSHHRDRERRHYTSSTPKKSKILSSTLRNANVYKYTKMLESLDPNQDDAEYMHPYKKAEKVEYVKINPPQELENKEKRHVLIDPFNDSKALLSNVVSAISRIHQLKQGEKEKIYPISTGKCHKPTPESKTLQLSLQERTKVVQALNDKPEDDKLNQRLADIDKSISSWHKNILQAPPKPLKIEQLTPYIPDLPADYLMQKHSYQPNPVAMKLMSKMGWKPGTSLGREQKSSGNDILKLEIKYDRSGLRSISEFPQELNLPQLLGKHPVSALMELCQKMKWTDPLFEDVPGERFLTKVTVKGRSYVPPRRSPTKKASRMEAALYALIGMGLIPDPNEPPPPTITALNEQQQQPPVEMFLPPGHQGLPPPPEEFLQMHLELSQNFFAFAHMISASNASGAGLPPIDHSLSLPIPVPLPNLPHGPPPHIPNMLPADSHMLPHADMLPSPAMSPYPFPPNMAAHIPMPASLPNSNQSTSTSFFPPLPSSLAFNDLLFGRPKFTSNGLNNIPLPAGANESVCSLVDSNRIVNNFIGNNI